MTKEIDITAFDSVGDCEQGQALAIKGDDGRDTGITLMVQGKHSNIVTKWLSGVVHASMREQQIAQKRGKLVEPKTVEEVNAQNVEGAAIRVTGWRGPKQQFSNDLLKATLARNPQWIEQIIDFSDDMGNFTKGSGATSPSTSSNTLG